MVAAWWSRPGTSPRMPLPVHGGARPARSVCPLLPRAAPPAGPPFLSCSRPLPLLPAAPAPVWSWHYLAPLPVPPDRKTNGRRPHPAGCLPLYPAPLSLPLRLRPPASPAPQRSASLPLPCLFHPDVAAAPRPALPSSQKDKRRAPAPRGVPCRPLLPHGGGKRVTRFPCRPAAVLSLPPAGMLALADIYGVNNILGSQRASCAP